MLLTLSLLFSIPFFIAVSGNRKIMNKRFLYGVYMAVILLWPFSILAQYNPTGSNMVIKLDTATRLPSDGKAIPFDQPFTLVLTPKNPGNIIDVLAYRVITRNGAKSIDPGTWPIKGVRPVIQGAQLAIDFPAIPPDLHFDFCLLRQLDGTNLDEFMSYANVVARTRPALARFLPINAADQNTKEREYISFINRLEKTPNNYNNTSAFVFDYLFNSTCTAQMVGVAGAGCGTRNLESLFNTTLDQEYLAILRFNYIPPAYPVGRSLLNDLIATSQTFRTKKINDQTISSLIRIVDQRQQNNLYSGFIPLNYNYQTKAIDRFAIKQRLLNITNAYQHCAGLLDTLERASHELVAPDPAIGILRDYMKLVVIQLDTNKHNIDEHYSTIYKYFQNQPGLEYTEWFVNNSDAPKDLQTRSTTLFVPQMGISFLAVRPNGGGNLVIPKLTLGLNVNFRPTDKSIPRNQIPDSIRGPFFSGFVGLSFAKFKSTEYDNLFATNSLLAGFSIKMTRSLYFSYGLSFYRQQNKNPVINDYHTAVGFYGALMLDVDILSAASSLTSILFK
jgi:hypothetical protein